jgi:hypothetical protein
MRPCTEQFNDLVPLSSFRSWLGCITNTSGYDFRKGQPDHSTFSVNRHGRFRSSNIFRQLFEAVVRACMDAGLVQGEGFAIDASVMEANASRYRGKAPDEIDWSAPERQTCAVIEFRGDERVPCCESDDFFADWVIRRCER